MFDSVTPEVAASFAFLFFILDLSIWAARSMREALRQRPAIHFECDIGEPP